jgi:hypothetical protein
MAETVTELRPHPPKRPKTSTERVRAFRKRHGRRARVEGVSATEFLGVSSATETAVSVSAHRETPAVTVVTLTAALALATCSAAFSISGLTAIFAGAFWPVVGMGVALELGKLSAVAWLGSASNGSRVVKLALVVLVAVLMGLNAIGIYGYLSRAHIAHTLAGDIAVSGRAADVEARLTVQANILADLDKRIAQIDAAIDEAAKRGHTNGAMSLAADQRKTRADIVTARIKEAKTLAGLQVEKTGIDGERKTAEADLGPVRYLS